MRVAYSVSKVRAAEAALMALVPDGALMQRAAAGLASVCAGLLRDGAGGVYGARVVVLAIDRPHCTHARTSITRASSHVET